MRLSTSLRTECGAQGFLPTTLGYNKRLKKQAAKLEKQRKEFERNQNLIKARKAKEEYERKRAEELEKLRRENPQKYNELQHQQLMNQLQAQASSYRQGVYYR